MDCPLYFDDCDSICMHYGDGCGWFLPSKPFSELLTLEERLERLEGKHIPRIEVKHVTVYEKKQKDEYTIG